MDRHPDILNAEDEAPLRQRAAEQYRSAPTELSADEIDRHHAEIERQDAKAPPQVEHSKVVGGGSVVQEDARDQVELRNPLLPALALALMHDSGIAKWRRNLNPTRQETGSV
jgi:hypothetical protein